MPLVTVPPNPNGLPSAMIVSPSSKSSSAANLIVENFSPLELRIFSNATSVNEVPTMRSASYSFPSARRTKTFVARFTTWKLVITQPSSSMMTPEPRL